MAKKILFSFVISAFLTLLLPHQASAIQQFEGYQSCQSSLPATTTQSRPAAGESCDPGYPYAASSCARTMLVQKTIMIRHNEGPCITDKVWSTNIYIDLSQTTLPFVGKNEQENAGLYLADYLGGTTAYKLRLGTENLLHNGVLNRLGMTPYLDRLRKSVIARYRMKEIHNYTITNGVETLHLSDFTEKTYPPEDQDERDYWAKNTPQGRLWEYIPLITQEDSVGWIKPYANLGPKDKFEIVNADFIEPEGIQIAVPHLTRLANALSDLQRFGVFNEDYEELAAYDSSPAPIIAVGEEEKEPTTQSQVFSSLNNINNYGCSISEPEPINACMKQPLFDDKANDPLLGDPPLNPEKSTIVARLEVHDDFENPEYIPCDYRPVCVNPEIVTDCDRECQSGDPICPPEPGSPRTKCCRQLDDDICEKEFAVTLGRQVGIDIKLNWINPIWQYLCGNPTNTFPLYWGFAKQIFPPGENPCDDWNNVYGGSFVSYRCDDCDLISPSVGTLAYPKLGGIDMVISSMKDALLPPDWQL